MLRSLLYLNRAKLQFAHRCRSNIYLLDERTTHSLIRAVLRTQLAAWEPAEMISCLASGSQLCGVRAADRNSHVLHPRPRLHFGSPSQTPSLFARRHAGGPDESSLRRLLTCKAASSSMGGADDSSSPQMPESRDQAVEQASAAIAAQLVSGKKIKAKGFAGSGSSKLSVEIPVADSSAAAALSLAQDLVQKLPPQLRTQFVVVSALPPSNAASSQQPQQGAPVLSLEQCLKSRKELSGCLLILGATKQQIGDVSRLLGLWKGAGAVLLNSDWWSSDFVPPEHAAFVATFDSVYSFVPLEVKAFVTTQQGAVFRWVQGGAPSAAPWRIFSLKGKAWASIGRMQRRPTQADIETAFYNASAAQSPITAGAKFLRGLVPGGNKQQQK